MITLLSVIMTPFTLYGGKKTKGKLLNMVKKHSE